MIKNIIFDIGQVLVEFNWEEFFRQHFSEGDFEKVSNATVLNEKIWSEMDRGTLSFDEVIDLIVKEQDFLKDNIKEILIGLYKSVLPFNYSKNMIKSLKEKGYNIYLLSNFGEVPFNLAKERFDFMEYVDGGIISYEVKMIKPEPLIYKAILEKYNLVASECVFLDDNANNIKEAKSQAFNTVHFTDYQSSVKQLNDLLKRKGLVNF